MKKENTAMRLKKIMDTRNLRQVDILNLTVPYCQKYNVKMNKSDISQYCSGKTEPNQDKLYILGAALNVDEAWLMGYDVPMERNNYEDPTILKRDAILEDIENIVRKAGYIFSCESYDDDFFLIKQPYGQTIASFYDYELIPKYELLKRNGKLTAELLISNSSKLCPEEWEHIEKYRSLDPHGKDMVDTVLDRENKRIQQYGKLEDRNVVILAEYEASKAPTHIIPYWEYGVSAGNGIYQLNDTTSVMMTLWATEVTKQADFIIKVSGASMEPDYHDGDKVLVDRKTVVEKGEVGIFVKNGDTYMKELGENELISRNSEFPNIPVKDFDNVVCLGKVIGILTDSLIAKE